MNDDHDADTVFRDIIFLALLGFVTLVVLLLPHINPPTDGKDDIKPPGNLIVEARWADELDIDVDLWVKAPNDRPVGFARKGGEVFDLLRDDLGFERDSTGLNYEFAFSRGAPAGEYIVNVHLYSNRADAPGVMVNVVISLSSIDEGDPVVIINKQVRLNHTGHEITVARFSLNEDSLLMRETINDFPVTLKGRR